MTAFILFVIFAIPTTLAFRAACGAVSEIFYDNASNAKVVESIAHLLLLSVLLTAMNGSVPCIIASGVLMCITNADKWQALKNIYCNNNDNVVIKCINVTIMASLNLVRVASEFTSSVYAKAA